MSTPADTLTPCTPYLRIYKSQPMLVLTLPEQRAVCITADGEVIERPLIGTRVVLHEKTEPTPAQIAALRPLSNLRREWREYVQRRDAGKRALESAGYEKPEPIRLRCPVWGETGLKPVADR